MSLSQENQVLVAKLEAVHQRAVSGDREAVHFIKSLKTRALAGEDKARRVYNTLAVIHWKKQKGGDYDRAEAYYLRLKAREPQAQAKFQTLITRVRSGDPEARTLFSVLKSIHHKFKSSAFSDGPGAPRVGGYGLPQEHRAGIIIGAERPTFQPATIYPGHGGGYPMSRYPQNGQHGQPFIPGQGFAHGRRRFNRFNVAGTAIGAIEPLTAQAVVNLVSLMVKVRAMPIAAAALAAIPQSFSTRSLSADSGLGGGGSSQFTTTPSPSGFSTVPQPSGGAVTSQSASSSASSSAKLATQTDIIAFKSTLPGDLSSVASAGRMIAALNPAIAAARNPPAVGLPDPFLPYFQFGFDIGTVGSMGNSVMGPGQQSYRDRITSDLMAQGRARGDSNQVSSNAVGAAQNGYDAAQQQQYAFTRAGRAIVLPGSVNTSALSQVKLMTEAERAAMMANQGICNKAAEGLQRGIASAPGLVDQCKQARAANIAKGEYFADAMSPDDPGYRVALANAGLAVVSRNPALKAMADSLMAKDPTGAVSRGFVMAMGVRAGKMDPAFPAFVRPALSRDPNLIAGFDLGMNAQ